MRDQRITRTCAHCNTSFLVKQSRAANGRGTFCGLPCKRAASYLDKTCSVDDCERPAWNRGWCRLHYARWFRSIDLLGDARETAELQFWAKVEKNGPIPPARPDLGPCWIWTASRDHKGYGVFRSQKAYSIAYKWAAGPVPEGLEIDHLCTVRSCVNPSHLEPVSHAENVRRGRAGAVNREKTACLRGHPFDDLNTYISPSSGKRACRTCHSSLRPPDKSDPAGEIAS
jgi:hypothetical protein